MFQANVPFHKAGEMFQANVPFHKAGVMLLELKSESRNNYISLLRNKAWNRPG